MCYILYNTYIYYTLYILYPIYIIYYLHTLYTIYVYICKYIHIYILYLITEGHDGMVFLYVYYMFIRVFSHHREFTLVF